MGHTQNSWKSGKRLPAGAGMLVFLAIIVFFLWEEHKVHITGALPWTLLALCLLVHFFMHRGHRHSGDHEALSGGGPETHGTHTETEGSE